MTREMRTKVQDRYTAIALRKQGKSYREILAKVPVSKGTLSKWLQHVPLTKKEEKYLRERTAVLQDKGRLKVAAQNSERNEARRERVRVLARTDFRRHRDNPFFTAGIALYWSHGAKTGSCFNFVTADVAMMRFMLAWVERYLPVEPSEYRFRLHCYSIYKQDNLERRWSRDLAIPHSQFSETSLKRSPRTLAKDKNYRGSLRLLLPGVDRLITLETWQTELSLYYVGA